MSDSLIIHLRYSRDEEKRIAIMRLRELIELLLPE